MQDDSLPDRGQRRHPRQPAEPKRTRELHAFGHGPPDTKQCGGDKVTRWQRPLA